MKQPPPPRHENNNAVGDKSRTASPSDKRKNPDPDNTAHQTSIRIRYLRQARETSGTALSIRARGSSRRDVTLSQNSLGKQRHSHSAVLGVAVTMGMHLTADTRDERCLARRLIFTRLSCAFVRRLSSSVK